MNEEITTNRVWDLRDHDSYDDCNARSEHPQRHHVPAAVKPMAAPMLLWDVQLTLCRLILLCPDARRDRLRLLWLCVLRQTC